MSDNLTGQSLGRYQILEQLGRGGMAVVYKAFDTSLERHVALKVILPYREHSEKFLARFRREAKALAKLSHPNILKIFDYGEFENQPYLVMEYIPGGTLVQRLKGKALPWRESAQFLARVARALETAHEQGIIHRDVKPANILLANGHDPMLSDFGIAKMIESNEETADLTGTGVGIGTPEYMAPEQGFGQADERSDIYALGVILYEMVTGCKPYQADTPMAIMLKKNTEPLPRPTQYVHDLPVAVENVLIKALARDPKHRYHAMGAYATALERLAEQKDTSKTITDTLDDLDRTSTLNEGTEKRSGGWAPWLAAIGLLSVCCIAIMAGALIWPMISAIPTPTQEGNPLPSPTLEWAPTMALSDTPTPIPTSLPPSTGTWIAFNSRMSGNSDIYLVDVNGNNLTQLTKNSVHDWYPSWSPDGKYLVYQTKEAGGMELAIIVIATKQIMRLTNNGCDDWGPTWSPDGEWIAFYSNCNGEREVYKIRSNGNDRQQLTYTSGAYSWFPSWSPDGTKITFSSNRSGRFHIYVMNVDGSNQLDLADGCVSYFSPDGSQILYGMYCDDTDDLLLMNADGKNQHPITEGCQCKNATWSPDGTKIVFQASKNGKDGPFAMYIMSLDTPGPSDWIMITDYNINGGSPVWQP